MKVIIEISARHIHISPQDLEVLFGSGYELTVLKELSQPGQFAANETITIKTEKGAIEGVRILGPVRKQTQIEISRTDSFKLGVKPPVRESGVLAGSEKVTIIGPKGQVDLSEGMIVAWRHIHISAEEAEKNGLKDKQMVSVKVEGERGLTFHEVLIRAKPDFITRMHIDTDEANAAGLAGETEGEVIII